MRAARPILAALLLLAIGTGSLPSFAAEGKASAAATEAMLKAENLGGLKLDSSEKSVVQLLGKPEKQTALIFQGADGLYVQQWLYPAKGIELTMTTGEKKTGAKKVVNITAKAPSPLATQRGIKIGSPESDVRKAYGAYVSADEPAEPGTLVAGSIYGGVIFNFSKGKVSRIFIGAAAE